MNMPEREGHISIRIARTGRGNSVIVIPYTWGEGIERSAGRIRLWKKGYLIKPLDVSQVTEAILNCMSCGLTVLPQRLIEPDAWTFCMFSFYRDSCVRRGETRSQDQ